MGYATLFIIHIPPHKIKRSIVAVSSYPHSVCVHTWAVSFLLSFCYNKLRQAVRRLAHPAKEVIVMEQAIVYLTLLFLVCYLIEKR